MNTCPQCQSDVAKAAVICIKCGFSLEGTELDTRFFSGYEEIRAKNKLSEESMTPEKWQKVKHVFATVQAIPEAERRDYISEACEGDEEISGEVIFLLDSYSEDDEFLEDSAVAEVASMIDEGFGSGEEADATIEQRFAAGVVLDNRYEIVRMLGKGGMGEVYLANDTNLERKVALKVLPSELTESKSRLKRFEQEARAVSALNHPHILTIFEFGQSGDGDHFIASEYVEGKTLNDFSTTLELSLTKVLDIAMQVASALGAAHEAGITHRDIKPDNIMVRKDGYIKVLDFGLAKLTEPEHLRSPDPDAATKAMVNTAPGSIMGTAAYMSPEQARGKDVDARSDIWSLGVVIYELLTRQQPFKGETSTDTILAVIKKNPVPLINYIADLPNEVEWIVSKTLSKELDGRYQTARELFADLEKIKKRVEFLDERDRTSQPVRDKEGNVEMPTEILEAEKTDLRPAETTKEITEGLHSSEAPHRESSVEYVVQGAFQHKAMAAVFAIILLVGLSAGFYYIVISGGSGSIDSIAVLPFENGNSGPEINYLSEGISESLIDRLSELPQLKVIARSSSAKFNSKNADIKEIARRLGVKAILMGKVTQIDEMLSIRVELIDAVENKQLWGTTYERKPGDILGLQNEIAQTVSKSLKLELSNAQEQRLVNNGTENSEAFQNYLSGLVEIRRDGGSSRADEYFLKSLELDPGFAPANAQLSLIYSANAATRDDPRELMPKAKKYALRALELDKDLAVAHVALATVQEFEFDWKGAESSYKRAIELSPNLDLARNRYSFFLSVMGRQDEAMQQNDQAMLRDPVNKRLHIQFKAMNQIQARKFDEGLKGFTEVKNMKEAGNTVNFQMGYALAGKGMFKEAADSYKIAVDEYGGEDKYTQPLIYMAAALARIPERRAEAVAIARKMETTSEYVSPSLMAVIYASLDENGKAMDELDKAYGQRDVLLRYIKVAYEYDSLRNDPRFKELLKKTGLAN